MRYIDLETWPRRKHFEFFNSWDNPHFNLCANVDLTAFYPYVKQHRLAFNTAIVYVIARAANAVPEFRYRIRGDQVVQHDVVHPATTILTGDDLFSFCFVNYTDDFSVFEAQMTAEVARLKENPLLEDAPGKDDLLYMTAIPWVSFTSCVHPFSFPVDSVPRFAWGKYFEDGTSLKMPLSVQAHHALVDGIHAGRYYAQIQDYLSSPGDVLGK